MSISILTNGFLSGGKRELRFYNRIAPIEPEVVGPLGPFRTAGRLTNKITIIIRSQEELDEAEAFFTAAYGDQVAVLQTRPSFLEITDRRATKGQALRRLAEREGIRRDEIIAFGDSCNDLDMLTYAGLGVAVANAMPAVRRAADLVTAANDADGVAEVIEKYVLL